MLVHFRLNVPAARVEDVLTLLRDDERVTNVSHFTGASVRPRGDVIDVDVAREAASDILDELDSLGLKRDGGIVLLQPLGAPFDAAEAVDKAAHGDPDDAVIWHILEDGAKSASKPTPSYMVFLIIATALAAVAVITDSAVLVVGAMVVGPEFAVVAAIATGLAMRRWKLAARSVWTLAWTFAAAIAVITILAWLAVAFGLVTSADVTRARPQTEFIWRPDVWSFVVALLAGCAGVLAAATDKANAMVGVFISVTTVPAAGNLALGLAVLSLPEITGSAAQLGVNLLGMTLAGVLTLVVQRAIWRHLGASRRQSLTHRHLEQR